MWRLFALASHTPPTLSMQPTGVRDIITRVQGGCHKVGNGVWTQSGGIQSPLGTLGGCCTQAQGVSPDGSVITGWSVTSSGFLHAFRWTPRKGMEDIQSLLTKAGVSSVRGWILQTARRVSADGTIIVGTGLNPNKQSEAFRAVLPLP